MDEIEFEKELQDEYFKEIKSSLDDILRVLTKREESEMLGAFEKYTKVIEDVLENIKNLSQPDQKGVVESLGKIEQNLLTEQKSLLILIKQLLTQLKEKHSWQFFIHRDTAGNMNNIIINQL